MFQLSHGMDFGICWNPKLMTGRYTNTPVSKHHPETASSPEVDRLAQIMDHV